MSLEGLHALVTGGARGLGFVMAEALAQGGAQVTITAARSPDQLGEAKAKLEAIAPGRIFAALGDTADAAACAHVVAAAEAALGPIAILVNNAARGPREQPLSGDTVPGSAPLAIDPWALDPAIYAAMLVGNIAGTWNMTRLVVSGMVARGFGRIVNISTSRPTMEIAAGGAYGPSKAAVEAQARGWAKRLASSGVTVNVLLPGGQTDTPFLAPDSARTFIDWPARAGTIREGAEKGVLPPQVMAAPIAFLASRAASDITGRRFVGANWPPHLPAEAALALAESPL